MAIARPVTPSEMSLERLQSSRTPQERFDDYLQSRGMRGTRQRRRLLELVCQQQHHFDVEQLLAQLPQRGQAGYVSRPTVYRTLGEFVDAGLLRTFELGGRSVYEHDYGYPPHDHLHCQQCGKLFEFQEEQLAPLVAKISRDKNFAQLSHRLIIQGTCAECRQQQRRQRKRVDLI